MINEMWTQPPDQWDDCLQERHFSGFAQRVVLRMSWINYRFYGAFYPLSAGSLPKVIAVRLATWAQASKVLPPTQ